ncbi:MAG: hypothetical protein ISS88_01725 [Candidatus Portnoybacteria bacterium]|nr:hypothetical protein [Candidatus Portnoybacteria bacterium]
MRSKNEEHVIYSIMDKIIGQKEIEEIFEEYIEENEIEIDEKKNFEDFLRFLGVDFYDWLRENLRCYFRED